MFPLCSPVRPVVKLFSSPHAVTASATVRGERPNLVRCGGEIENVAVAQHGQDKSVVNADAIGPQFLEFGDDGAAEIAAIH